MKPQLVILTVACFLINSVIGPIPLAIADDFRLPAPGVMVRLSPPLDPPILKGIKVHPDNPFRFEFILDKGDSALSNNQLKDESTKLIKYFLASLTIPEKDLWVNLSPYEKDRIVPESFGRTEMGRDLLAEDYMLKQITASLIYPEGETGKKFWKRIYEEAAKRFGTTDIPVNTFNKVWIIPEKAVVYENAKAGTAYVVESKLKVMLEQDYLSLQKHEGIQSERVQINGTNHLGSQIVREIVIPELTKEVNEDKNFVKLRQVYNSLILATWYKKKIKDSILEQVYADKNKIVGVRYSSTIIPVKAGIKFKNDVEGLYKEYLRAFKKGVYNYIKEEIDPISQQMIPRKYFSGGLFMGARAMNAAMIISDNTASLPDIANDNVMIINTSINPVNEMGGRGFIGSDQAMKPRDAAMKAGNGMIGKIRGLFTVALLSSLLMACSSPITLGVLNQGLKGKHVSLIGHSHAIIESGLLLDFYDNFKFTERSQEEKKNLLKKEQMILSVILPVAQEYREDLGLLLKWIEEHKVSPDGMAIGVELTPEELESDINDMDRISPKIRKVLEYLGEDNVEGRTQAIMLDIFGASLVAKYYHLAGIDFKLVGLEDENTKKESKYLLMSSLGQVFELISSMNIDLSKLDPSNPDTWPESLKIIKYFSTNLSLGKITDYQKALDDVKVKLKLNPEQGRILQGIYDKQNKMLTEQLKKRNKPIVINIGKLSEGEVELTIGAGHIDDLQELLKPYMQPKILKNSLSSPNNAMTIFDHAMKITDASMLGRRGFVVGGTTAAVLAKSLTPAKAGEFEAAREIKRINSVIDMTGYNKGRDTTNDHLTPEMARSAIVGTIERMFRLSSDPDHNINILRNIDHIIFSSDVPFAETRYDYKSNQNTLVISPIFLNSVPQEMLNLLLITTIPHEAVHAKDNHDVRKGVAPFGFNDPRFNGWKEQRGHAESDWWEIRIMGNKASRRWEWTSRHFGDRDIKGEKFRGVLANNQLGDYLNYPSQKDIWMPGLNDFERILLKGFELKGVVKTPSVEFADLKAEYDQYGKPEGTLVLQFYLDNRLMFTRFRLTAKQMILIDRPIDLKTSLPLNLDLPNVIYTVTASPDQAMESTDAAMNVTEQWQYALQKNLFLDLAGRVKAGLQYDLSRRDIVDVIINPQFNILFSEIEGRPADFPLEGTRFLKRNLLLKGQRDFLITTANERILQNLRIILYQRILARYAPKDYVFRGIIGNPKRSLGLLYSYSFIGRYFYEELLEWKNENKKSTMDELADRLVHIGDWKFDTLDRMDRLAQDICFHVIQRNGPISDHSRPDPLHNNDEQNALIDYVRHFDAQEEERIIKDRMKGQIIFWELMDVLRNRREASRIYRSYLNVRSRAGEGVEGEKFLREDLRGDESIPENWQYLLQAISTYSNGKYRPDNINRKIVDILIRDFKWLQNILDPDRFQKERLPTTYTIFGKPSFELKRFIRKIQPDSIDEVHLADWVKIDLKPDPDRRMRPVEGKVVEIVKDRHGRIVRMDLSGPVFVDLHQQIDVKLIQDIEVYAIDILTAGLKPIGSKIEENQELSLSPAPTRIYINRDGLVVHMFSWLDLGVGYYDAVVNKDTYAGIRLNDLGNTRFKESMQDGFVGFNPMTKEWEVFPADKKGEPAGFTLLKRSDNADPDAAMHVENVPLKGLLAIGKSTSGADALHQTAKGGIDLTPANMNLQTQNAGEGIKFHINPLMLKQLENAPGFVPMIISIKPMLNIRAFLGLNTVANDNYLKAANDNQSVAILKAG